MRTQHVKVSVIGDARRGRHDDSEFASRGSLRTIGLFGLYRILGIEMQAVQIGQHAEHRLGSLRLKPHEARIEQGFVAAKAVDDEALGARLLRG